MTMTTTTTTVTDDVDKIIDLIMFNLLFDRWPVVGGR